MGPAIPFDTFVLTNRGPVFIFPLTLPPPVEATTLEEVYVERFDEDRPAVRIKEEGGEILFGGEMLDGSEYPGGCYVRPCIAAARNEMAIVQDETFAPILYIIPYQTLDEAIALHNGVPQGLSSAIFTTNML